MFRRNYPEDATARAKEEIAWTIDNLLAAAKQLRQQIDDQQDIIEEARHTKRYLRDLEQEQLALAGRLATAIGE